MGAPGGDRAPIGRPKNKSGKFDDRVRSVPSCEMGSLEEELRLEILKSRVGGGRARRPPGLRRAAEACSPSSPGRSRRDGRDLDGALDRLLAHTTEKRAGLR